MLPQRKKPTSLDLKQKKSERLKSAYLRFSTPTSKFINIEQHPISLSSSSSTLSSSSPLSSSSSLPLSTSQSTKTQMSEQHITLIELEFILQELSTTAQMFSLWRKTMIPVDVYLKMTYTNGETRMITVSAETIYSPQVSNFVQTETFTIFSGHTSFYNEFYQTTSQYRKKVTLRTDPSLGLSFLVRFCKTRPDELSSPLVIYQSHHFILNLLNTFQLIINKNKGSKSPLLTIVENNTLEQFYNNCKILFDQELV